MSTSPCDAPSPRPTNMTRTLIAQCSLLVSSRRLFSTLLFGVIIFGLAISGNQAEMCRKLKLSGDPELFQCPRIFEQKTKSWCCGSNTLDSYCCEWSDRAKEAGLGIGTLQDSVKYLVMMVVALVFLVAFLWAMCYFASKQNLFQHQRHRNVHESQTGYPHHPGAPPLTPPFPPVPPYSAYPNAAYPSEQNCTDLPPSYTQLYGNGDAASPTAPVSVPLLAAEQKDTTDLKDESVESPRPPTPTTPPPPSADSMAITIIKNPSAGHQPPFNPTYT